MPIEDFIYQEHLNRIGAALAQAHAEHPDSVSIPLLHTALATGFTNTLKLDRPALVMPDGGGPKPPAAS